MIVYLNDYVCCSRSHIIYMPEDKASLTKRYRADDAQDLKGLVHLKPLMGYQAWHELTPNHYRMLITNALNLFSDLPETDQKDSKNSAVVSLHKIIYFFILCLEDRTESYFEHFRINRFTRLDVSFDYGGSFEINYTYPRGKHDADMRLIVLDDDTLK